MAANRDRMYSLYDSRLSRVNLWSLRGELTGSGATAYGRRMRFVVTSLVLLVIPAALQANAPIPSASMPTLGEGALLTLCVALPLAGAAHLHRKLRSKQRKPADRRA